MEPVAWMVFCPRGYDYDYIVAADRGNAEYHADTFNQGLAEGEPEYEVIPLYHEDVVKTLKLKLREANHKIESLRRAARSRYHSDTDYLPHQDEDEHR